MTFQLLAAHGLNTFPIQRPLKTPALKWEHFQSHRSTPDQHEQWAGANYNTGIATGAISGVVIFDLDSVDAFLAAMERGLPPTLTFRTPRGWHHVYQHPGGHCGNRANVGKALGVPGWDIRGDGGYVVGPGSYYVPTAAELAAGKVEGAYTIESDLPVAPMPDWLAALLVRPEIVPLPPGAARVAETTSPYGLRAMNDELAVLAAAQSGEVNDTLNRVAFAIGQLVGGGEITHDDASGAIDEALQARGIMDEPKTVDTVARAYADGQEQPRSAPPPNPPRTAEEVFGKREMEVPDPPSGLPALVDIPNPPRVLSLSDDQLSDKGDHLAIEFYIGGLGLVPAYDEFADQVMLGGRPLTDHTERKAWFDVREMSGLKFAKDLFGETLRAMAWANKFHPLKQYLDRAQPMWDGASRLDSWLTEYLGVESTPYSRAVGRLFLVAAVRRARQPGAKFDELMVLEGPQGMEKSTAIATLSPVYGWFCDDVHVGMKSKELLEVTAGKWLVEAPELSKMHDSEIEHVKAMLSRQVDRSRLAYERNSTERGRHWVAFATTNADRYLRDASGNRRIWPVRCQAINVAAITADRDQLWAEAAVAEAAGESIRLDQSLWLDAAAEQEARMVDDPFESRLHEALGDMAGRIRTEILWSILGITIDKRRQHVRALGDAMRRLGWHHARLRVDGNRTPYYAKPGSDAEIEFDDQRRLAPTLTAVQ